MGEHRGRTLQHGFRLVIALLLVAALAAAGGASLYSEDQQMLARLAAIAALVATLWPLETGALNQHKGVLLGIGAAYVLILVQLIPMPPELWASLPGREPYAEIARETGTAGWRPLSLTPDLTLNALLALLPATAATYCALHLNGRGRARLLQALVLVACLSAALGLLQASMGGEALHLYRETSDDSPVGLFANRNHQAVLLACALPLIGAIAGMRVREGADPRKALLVAMALATLALLALVATGSRMGVLLAAIGAAAGLWCYVAANPVDWRMGLATRISAVAVGAALIGAVGLVAARSGAIERLALTDTVTETRAAMLAPLLETARAFMPVGAGFGSFDSVYRRFEPDALLSTIYMNHAHNEPLQLAIEGGLPAVALLALFCWWWVRTAVRLVARQGPVRPRTMGIAAVAVTAILLASSLVDYPLRTPLLGAVFAIGCVEMLRAAAAQQAGRSAAEAGLAEPGSRQRRVDRPAELSPAS